MRIGEMRISLLGVKRLKQLNRSLSLTYSGHLVHCRSIKELLKCFFVHSHSGWLPGVSQWIRWPSAPKIETTTQAMRSTVPCITKAPGGTTSGTNPTWTACTTTVHARLTVTAQHLPPPTRAFNFSDFMRSNSPPPGPKNLFKCPHVKSNGRSNASPTGPSFWVT